MIDGLRAALTILEHSSKGPASRINQEMRALYRSIGIRLVIIHFKMTIEFQENPKVQIWKNFQNL